MCTDYIKVTYLEGLSCPLVLKDNLHQRRHYHVTYVISKCRHCPWRSLMQEQFCIFGKCTWVADFIISSAAIKVNSSEHEGFFLVLWEHSQCFFTFLNLKWFLFFNLNFNSSLPHGHANMKKRFLVMLEKNEKKNLFLCFERHPLFWAVSQLVSVNVWSFLNGPGPCLCVVRYLTA